jgi:hypothetical protein
MRRIFSVVDIVVLSICIPSRGDSSTISTVGKPSAAVTTSRSTPFGLIPRIAWLPSPVPWPPDKHLGKIHTTFYRGDHFVNLFGEDFRRILANFIGLIPLGYLENSDHNWALLTFLSLELGL